MADFKDRLRGMRCERHMTQQELAKAVGVSKASVSNWETGDNQPTLLVAIAIADVLGCTLDQLAGRDG